MWWKNSNWNYFKQKKGKLNKNIVRFSRRDWWAVLLCIGSHSKLWLNCVIIASLKFGSAVAAAFLHFTNSYIYTGPRGNTYIYTQYMSESAYMYALPVCMCVFVQQSDIHTIYKAHVWSSQPTHTHTCAWLNNTVSMRERCVASTRTHLLFTHCYAFARTHAA